MERTYAIEWKSKVNGRTGIGTTLFDRKEAEQLAEELNHDFPEIEHRALDTRSVSQHPTPALPVDRPG